MEGATTVAGEDLGTQSLTALYEAVDPDTIVNLSFLLDNYGDVYAVVEQPDMTMVLKRKCGGALVSPYVIGIGAGAIIGGLVGAKLGPLKRFRPASTLAGVAIGLVVGGVASHMIARKKSGSVAGHMGLIQANKMPRRGLGSLYLPHNGGLPRDTRIGLVEASKRYAPRGKNW